MIRETIQKIRLLDIKYSPPKIHRKEICELYDWQKEFGKFSNGKNRVLLSAPPGVGKTRTIKIQCREWNKKSRNNKSIILVPQKSIGAEYRNEYIMLENGEIFYWTNSRNIAFSKSNKNIEEIISFIENEFTRYDGNRSITCCNATLARAIKNVDKNKLKNIQVIFDEAHHIASEDEKLIRREGNLLGEICTTITKEKSNRVVAVSATPYRNDDKSMLPINEHFDKFTYPYYQAQEEIYKYTKQIMFDYCVYNDSFYKAIEKIYKNNEKTIIFVHSGTAYGGVEKKHDNVKKIINIINSSGGKIKEERENGCVVVKDRKGKDIVIADLITAGRQNKARIYLKQLRDEENYRVDVIIAMRMFIEGCDYPPLQHCIIDGIRNGIGNIIQMFGRTLRDYENKPYVRATLVLANVMNSDSDEEMYKKLDDHIKVIMNAFCYIDYFFNPINFSSFKEKKKYKKSGKKYESPLEDIGDFAEQNYFNECVLKEWTLRTLNNEKIRNSYKKRLEIMMDICKEILDNQNKKGNVKKIAIYILKKCDFSIRMRNDNYIISDKILEKVDTTGYLITYTSHMWGSEKFKKYKIKVLNFMEKRKSVEDHIKLYYDICKISSKTTWKNRNEHKEIWEKYYEENKLKNKGFIKDFHIALKEEFKLFNVKYPERKNFLEKI